jgi:hypothetical protein
VADLGIHSRNEKAMSAREVNTPGVIGVVLLIMLFVSIFAIGVHWLLGLARKHTQNRRIRVNDRNIFKTAEEARRDFS